jgi:hypothetical protein
MKEKTNGYISTVLEELERYQEELKMEALEDLEAFTKKQAEQDNREDDDDDSGDQ